jgi:hypothetical protein
LQTLGHAHDGGTGARIGADFFGGRLDPGDQFHFRLRQIDCTYREATVRLRYMGLASQELLDDAIFQ